MAVDERGDALPAAEPSTQRIHGLGLRHKDIMPSNPAMYQLARGRVHGDELPRQGVWRCVSGLGRTPPARCSAGMEYRP